MELPAISDSDLADRSEALLLGMTWAETNFSQGTAWTLAADLAESLVSEGTLDPQDLLRRWSGSKPSPDFGSTSLTALALELFRRGFPSQGLGEAAARLRPGRSGDGPLPRVLPIAIAARRDGAKLKRWAALAAGVTHADPSSRLAAVAACLLARDLLTHSLEDSLPRVGQALREEAPPRLAEVFLRPSRTGEPLTGDDAVAVLSQAIHSLHDAPGPQAAVAAARGWADPGSTALALTGGLAGAAFGTSTFGPDLQGIGDGVRQRLLGLSAQLVSLQAGPRGRTAPTTGRGSRVGNGQGPH